MLTPGATATCLICRNPLSELQRMQGERFCGARCRWKHTTLAPHLVCAACGRPLAPGEFGATRCASPGCRQQAAAQMRAHARRRREAVLRDAAEIRDRQAEALGIDDPQTYRLTIIPAYRARITNLPERRRRAFRDALNRLIGAASAHRTGPPPGAAGPPSGPGPADAPAPEVHAVLGRACALCQGECCAHGGEHAYLTAGTLRRYMEQHPDRRSRDVLADYLGCVGHRTVEGSCIFHGPAGCGLPREMRSDTCNRHLCPSLSEFSGCLPGPGPVRGFFVATIGGAIRGAAFCDASASRVVSPPPASDRQW